MKRYLFFVLLLFVAFSVLPEAGLAVSKSCDHSFGPDVYKPGPNKLIVCDSGTFNFRGVPSKANVTADTTNPTTTDTSVVTVQLNDDEGNAITSQSIVDVFVSDTSAGGNGTTALNGGTNANDGVSQVTGDSGTIFVEHTADAYFVLQTNDSGKATFQANDSQDVDRWINVLLETGEVKQLKIDFD